MKKATDLGENEVIHCPTEAEAIAICQLMHNAGLHWSDFDSYIKNNAWHIWRENSCYSPFKGLVLRLGECDAIHPASDFLPPSFYKVDEAHSSVVIDPVKHDEQPEPKVGQLWECINNELAKVHEDDITLGELYTICRIDSEGWVVICDNKGDERYYSPENTGEEAEFHTHFRFHSDPNEKPVMMVSDPTIPSPELLSVYEALDSEGKKIMREKMPSIKWPEVKEYVNIREAMDTELYILTNSETDRSKSWSVLFNHKNCTPEIDHEKGEIRFVKI